MTRPRYRLSAGHPVLLLLWIVLVQAVFAGIGVQAYTMLHGAKIAQQALYQTWMTPGMAEPGTPPPEPIPASGSFVPVTIGISLEDIETMSVHDSYWTTTFYIWFTWQGDRDLSPGQHFQIVGGHLERQEVVDEYHGADGTNYQQYRVLARIGHAFDATLVPLDRQMLTIDIEDLRADATALRYVADAGSDIGPRVAIAGYRVTNHEQVVKTHTYRSAYGDPRHAGTVASTFSQYRYGLTVERTGMGIYLKIFIGLFAGLALALTSFTLRAGLLGSRYDMLGGAFFGAVANSYLAGSLVPSSGEFGLVEYVTLTGLLAIFLAVAATAVSAHIWYDRGNQALSRAFDRASLAGLGSGYVILTLVLTVTA
jgi:hypothetical protein